MARKKKAVNDKYYQLAKEQGYRARSSFKIIQLNRKYDLLKNATRVIDLCAAPGGWLQVLAKSIPQSPERQIVGVDLLPIKPIRGCTVFQEDITSDTCRQKIRKEMRGNKADVVLCDGAPNVGAEYSKDAFVQNELAVYALKFACEHLKRGGSFVTKVFRSNDYTALLWAFQQLFKKVEATKPPSSRNVSAEIFVVCREYLAPHKIDPRLLDPRHVLSSVEQEQELTEQQAINKLFHKHDKQRRSRGGYSEDSGALVFKSASARDFIETSEPVQHLAVMSEINFKDEASKPLLELSITTPEIIEYLADLKVLGKAELRALLQWRTKVRDILKEQGNGDDDVDMEADDSEEEDGEEESEGEEQEDSDADDEDMDDMENLTEELKKIKEAEHQKRKREIKKLRKQRAKLQRRIDLGLENEFAHDLSEQQGPFSLSKIGLKSMQELSAIQSGEVPEGESSSEEGEEESDISEDSESDDEEDSNAALKYERKRLRELEREAEALYKMGRVKEQNNDPLTVRERRQQLNAEKKAKAKKRTLEALADQDFQRALEEEQAKAVKDGKYSAMLDQDSSEDDEDEEEEESEEEESEEEDNATAQAKNPLIKTIESKPSESMRAKAWFNQELFDGELDGMSDDDEDEEEASEGDDESSEDEDGDMPLPSDRTDKARRKEKRRKLKLRNERKAEKRRLAAAREADGALNEEMLLQAMPGGFKEVKADGGKNKKRRRGDEAEDEDIAGVLNRDVSRESDEEEDDDATREKKAAARKARKLIQKGMGRLGDVKESDGFEVVAAENNEDDSGSDIEDHEEAYNSEDYDTDERAQHIALAAMLTSKSKRRKVLDSAYNRYAFNDDDGSLPQWFIEDENKHNRPQLPVTKEMVDAVRARYKDIASKPINKVAEARARKKRKLELKIDRIKKQANAVAEQPDLNPGSKMRAIEKLYKGSQIKRPGAVYVVARKNGKKSAAQGTKTKGKSIKVVDKRMKADTHRLKKRGRGGKPSKRSRKK